MTNAALIVAAGRGSRMGAETPKQYLTLGEHAVLTHTIQAFLASDRIDCVRAVIHPEDYAPYTQATEDVTDPRLLPPVPGGATRAVSVRLGLEALAEVRPTHVLIHDAARPFCPPDLITRVIDALATAEGAFAALPVVDALWRTDGTKATTPVSREGLWRAQTPQAFRFDAILAAHRSGPEDAADDVAIARRAGLTVAVVDGSEENFKITRPADLDRAERLLAEWQS
ncbi:2-C-methyl-D-erythritol 4-phosphate cytidylyltransferase [Marivita hallyeonensis]|uniref:2-C-methyl-D-erythritol 4-phosphate cytidylyltransferase n=1 Tax=Marivita hallyeonensis TaxID=996342 RepID=A0A1M5Y3Q0_9RHOB|nr:2-C-methyl-D-erythritol 4-phosphate cytidylyltransferase [Marivita hallyeonensis]SHI06700.1 2-C-methyl-D-erythritol 4-phosphate cytidylyltransferase [Marivita hallyeonensis]